jgi:hypothetical protein
MKQLFSSLTTTRLGDWSIKASSLDDQIIICGFNEVTVDSFFKLFYSEDIAYIFVEGLYDKNSKIGYR